MRSIYLHAPVPATSRLRLPSSTRSRLQRRGPILNAPRLIDLASTSCPFSTLAFPFHHPVYPRGDTCVSSPLAPHSIVPPAARYLSTPFFNCSRVKKLNSGQLCACPCPRCKGATDPVRSPAHIRMVVGCNLVHAGSHPLNMNMGPSLASLYSSSVTSLEVSIVLGTTTSGSEVIGTPE